MKKKQLEHQEFNNFNLKMLYKNQINLLQMHMFKSFMLLFEVILSSLFFKERC